MRGCWVLIVMVCMAGFLHAADAPTATVPDDMNKAQTTGQKLDLSRFELVWQDEFEGDKLDPKKWDVPVQIRQGTSRWVKDLVSVGDGVLRIDIQKSDHPTYRYNSGAVRTRKDYDRNQTFFQQRYGYFEARCKMPKTVTGDYWAAFWMMCGNVSEKVAGTREGLEVDIMESFTFARGGKYSLAFHWHGYGKKHNATGLDCGPQPQVLDGQFHTFGLYWDANKYVVFLDGVEVGRTDLMNMGKDKEGLVKSQGPCQEPGYLKLSVEAAPWCGSSHLWQDDSPEKDEFLVDYVRAYQGTLE